MLMWLVDSHACIRSNSWLSPSVMASAATSQLTDWLTSCTVRNISCAVDNRLTKKFLAFVETKVHGRVHKSPWRAAPPRYRNPDFRMRAHGIVPFEHWGREFETHFGHGHF
jgi:hypothetical protein